MKQNIHPKWNHQAQVTCGCGNVFTTGSQQDQITVDICSACHPFFTGEMKFVDRQGRVDRFMQKVNVAQQKQAAKKSTKADKVEAPQEEAEPMSYKQLLQNEQNRLKTAKKAA
ncbi:50S ribosomal protein L31 [Patescibacteria group bacterium]|nr:50S ribosomal protein L31 [Patescibacteria group bacterium]